MRPIVQTTRANLALNTPLAVLLETLLKGTEVRLRTHEEVFQAISQVTLSEVKPATLTSELELITTFSSKDLLQAVCRSTASLTGS